MSTSSVMTILSSGTLAVVATAILDFWQKRKNIGAQTDKLGTEATKIITDAASGVVKDLREDSAQLRELLRLRDIRLGALELREDQLEEHVQALRDWAASAVVAIKAGDTTFAVPIPELHH